MSRRRRRGRFDRRLSAMAISPEETARVYAASGELRKELRIHTENPNPADFGLVQIAQEPDPLTPNYQLIQLKRQESVLRSIAREYPGLLHSTPSQRRQRPL